MFDLEYYNHITDYGKMLDKISNYPRFYPIVSGNSAINRLKNNTKSMLFEYDAMTLAIGRNYATWYLNYKL